MRVWMRFISTDPEFTWSGTGFILVATTLAGFLLGLGWARWRKAKGNWWRLSGLSLLLLGAGAGGVMIPSVALGALALGRENWHTAVRGILLAIAAALQILFFTVGPGDAFPPSKGVPAMVIYTVLISVEALAFSIPFRPSLAVSVAEIREPLSSGAADQASSLGSSSSS